jgi:uncharacterized protein
MPTALVTGAGRGLGAAFSARLARDGYDLVLVGRDRGALERTARSARRSGVAVEILVADLTASQDLDAVASRLADRSRPLDMLVNNAGYESGGEFVASDPLALQAEVDTNISAVLRLTRAALPGMTARGRGSVVNVASFAGYLPPAGSAYYATRAWALAFTDSVAPSLTAGVGMIALCAGRMRTGKHPGEPARPSPLWLEPEAVVDRCLADLARGRTLSTPGLVYRAVVAFLELPRRTLRAAARLAGRGRTRGGRRRSGGTTSRRSVRSAA